jgi:hypothetical protein
MGYESKLYVVEKSHKFSDEEKGYARIIAMFDMCKCGNLVNVFKNETDWYFYADDGNTQVLEDRYGDTLKEATVEEVIIAVEEIIASGDNYRRWFPLLATLKVIQNQCEQRIWKDIAVLHYGY